VLLAEDDVSVANALRRLLEGYVDVVGLVHDGLTLVQAARQLSPDVIVTDLSMPVMNGLEATRQLKQDGATARIILLTMHTETQLVAEAVRLGAHVVLTKYDAGDSLVDAIYQAFAADGTLRDLKEPSSLTDERE